MNLNNFEVTRDNLNIEVTKVDKIKSGIKMVEVTDFVYDRVQGSYSRVLNSFRPEWELSYGNHYCKSDSTDDIPFSESDIEFLYKAANKFGISSFPVLIGKTSEKVELKIESIDNVPMDSVHNIINVVIAIMHKYATGLVYMDGNDIYLDGDKLDYKYLYTPNKATISVSSGNGYIVTCASKDFVDFDETECYIFPVDNFAVFGTNAKSLLVEKIGIQNFKKSNLNKAFTARKGRCCGSYLPDGVEISGLK